MAFFIPLHTELSNEAMRKMIFLYVIGVVLPLAAQVQFIHLQPERLPDLNIPRFSHATFFINGELTVTGGHTSSFIPTPTAEFLKDGEWHVMQMAYTHDDGLCVPLRSGKVLLAGGYKENLGVGQTIEAELYDPATHTFEGFGCLDRKRAHVSGIELPNGQVVAAGNWYHPDAIETYDGGMYFKTAREVSVPRSFPHLFCTSDGDLMVVNECRDNYGKPIRSNIVDRLKGEPFRVPLLDTWRPYMIHLAPHSDESFIGDMKKGIFAYLLPVQDANGQVAIAEVRDTVFSLLPTVAPIPMKSRFGKITYNTPVIVDRQLQRGYIMGCDTLERKYILCIEYAKRPAPLTLYYTEPLTDACGCIPTLTPDGNLITTGGIAYGGTFFTPTKAVWLFPVGNRIATEEVAEEKGDSHWLWILLTVMLLAAVVTYLIIYRKRKHMGQKSVNTATYVPVSSTDPLMQRISELMDKQRPYLNDDLKMSDIATELDVHQNEVSACINSSKGCSFSQFVNGYRVAYAQQLMREHPDKKMAQVAFESGFSNDRSFYRAFKIITGKAPSEWVLQEID